jgi:hypothetical protein
MFPNIDFAAFYSRTALKYSPPGENIQPANFMKDLEEQKELYFLKSWQLSTNVVEFFCRHCRIFV